MLLPIFLLCLSYLVLACPVQPEYDVEDTEHLKYFFNNFKVKYNKSYTAVEEKMRLNYFKNNLLKINELNSQNPLAVYDINKFTDWSIKEIQNLFGFIGAVLDDDYGSCTTGSASDIKTDCVADAVDWRDKNAVTPVQNQEMCGSCWAFSAAAVIEGAHALKHNTLLKVSEQQFVDCDKKSFGCDGGWMHNALTSTIKQGGQELETDYPYEGKQEECIFDAGKAQVRVNACKVYPEIGDTDDKLAALVSSAGPLSIALDAGVFEFYKDGIITKCGGQQLNHGVALVGYGEEDGVPYWIIKNSWSEDWGEKGFVRVKRGEGCLMIGKYVVTADVA